VARPGRLPAGAWDGIFQLLLCRSGGLCEARTPACAAPGGRLEALDRGRVSIQHRRARGAGGTVLDETNNLANLLVICGDGVTACHGWIETQQRARARALGLMVDHTTDAAGRPVPVERYPVRVGGGRWRALDPVNPLYVDLPLELQWKTEMPLLYDYT
jgi:hypothetical protein